MSAPSPQVSIPAIAANVGANGSSERSGVHLITLVDLLAEAFVAKLIAANDNNAPRGE